MADIKFIKMHGAGNDFVIIDRRLHPEFEPKKADIKELCDRNFGIGCDQLIVLEVSTKADIFMRIYNPDASESEACGNASRCVADLMAREGKRNASIETLAGVLKTRSRQDGLFEINMGTPKLEWNEIPLSRKQDTLHLDLALDDNIRDPVAVNMGNPHAVFFVQNPDVIDLPVVGARLEFDPLFPQRANISFARVEPGKYLELRVWERGAGVTYACGTAACAAAVAAIRRGMYKRDEEISVVLPGGALRVVWSDVGDVLMSGESQEVFLGSFELEDFLL